MPACLRSSCVVAVALALTSLACGGDRSSSAADPLEAVCADAGGTVVSRQCCAAASDYPDTCLVGACGCSSENSVTRKVCECPADQCFDGTNCVARLESACTTSGGTVVTEQCCALAPDFPNTCLIGACGCSPENSVLRKVCACPADACFDGTGCVAR